MAAWGSDGLAAPAAHLGDPKGLFVAMTTPNQQGGFDIAAAITQHEQTLGVDKARNPLFDAAYKRMWGHFNARALKVRPNRRSCKAPTSVGGASSCVAMRVHCLRRRGAAVTHRSNHRLRPLGAWRCSLIGLARTRSRQHQRYHGVAP